MIHRTRASIAALAIASSTLFAAPAALATVPASNQVAPPGNCSAPACVWDQPNYRGHLTELQVYIGSCFTVTREIRSAYENFRGAELDPFHGKKCAGNPVVSIQGRAVPNIPSGSYSYRFFR